MTRKSRLRADDPRFNRELDEQVARLRQMLVLMAPETGSSALGASHEGFTDTRQASARGARPLPPLSPLRLLGGETSV